MATKSDDAQGTVGGLKSVLDELPLDRFKDEAKKGLLAWAENAVDSLGDKLGGATGEAAKGVAEGGASGGVKRGLSAVKDKVVDTVTGGGGGGGGSATKATTIIEEIDVGAPVDVVYNQWTQFQDYSNFMKKVESVDQEAEEKVEFKAQVFWSHRTWEATIVEQVPDDRIVWRSKGEKGHIDGAVTFHELAPRLTRVLVVLEYYPQGLFERTGNLWRAQGRRARLELKHFRRHVMMHLLPESERDSVEGWRGEIHDSEVERSHEDVVDEEAQYDDQAEPEEYEADDEFEDEEPEDEEPEDEEPEDEEPEDEPAEDEYEDEDEEYDEEDQEVAGQDEEPAPRRRRRSRSR